MAPDRAGLMRPYPAALLALAGVLLSCAQPQPQASPGASVARTVSPHGANPIACASCHQPGGWSPLRADAEFDHSRETSFELSGVHEQIDCGSCHLTLRFDEPHVAAGDCAACHVDVHSGELGQGCASCHDSRSFAARGDRDAHLGTSFPLTGRHRQLTCEACHAPAGEQSYAPLPTECVACHAGDYRAAVPDHTGAGFPTDCAACHGMFGWRGARFDHTTDAGYPLEGAHRTIDCQSCHTPPDFALVFAPAGPRDCIACHRDDYDRVHPNLGFPDDCLGCHTLDSFRGASWAEHDARFPIYSGKHDNRWTTCTQCHDGQGYASVTCLTCHEHSQARMDDKHKERSGYSYTTAACLSCHPRGDKG